MIRTKRQKIVSRKPETHTRYLRRLYTKKGSKNQQVTLSCLHSLEKGIHHRSGEDGVEDVVFRNHRNLGHPVRSESPSDECGMRETKVSKLVLHGSLRRTIVTPPYVTTRFCPYVLDTFHLE